MLAAATASIDLLTSSSAGSELASAHTHRAWALAHIYGVEAAAGEAAIALRETNHLIRIDTLTELSDLEIWFGDLGRARDYLAELEDMGERANWARSQVDATRASYALRSGNTQLAQSLLANLSLTKPCSSTAHKARLMATRAHLLVATASDQAPAAIEEARGQARRQSAAIWETFCQMLEAVSGDQDDLGRFIRLADREGMATLSMAAELAVAHLGRLSIEQSESVADEAIRRPERWREPLRQTIDIAGPSQLPAARLLEAIGTVDDVPRLRRVAKAQRGTPDARLGKALARRVAPRVFVEDQGRVSIAIGPRVVDGSSIRRKVLGLLCFSCPDRDSRLPETRFLMPSGPTSILPMR